MYEVAVGHSPKSAVIVPPRSTVAQNASAETIPTRRHQHIHEMAGHDRMGRQKSTGYNLRSTVEASNGRYKRGIGNALRSQTDGTEATEIAAAAVNRMLSCGRPNYVRIV